MICWQEPKTTRRKHAGYSNIIKDAVRLVKEVDSPHIKILFDLYHLQLSSYQVWQV